MEVKFIKSYLELIRVIRFEIIFIILVYAFHDYDASL